jgi:hypothetical protein
MLPDVTGLARHTGLNVARLRDDITRQGETLSPLEHQHFTIILEIADRTANATASVPTLVSDLAALARDTVAGPDSSKVIRERPGVDVRLRRELSARTLHALRELRLYRDTDGVEPVWPHAGMLILNPILGCNFGCVYCFRADEQRESVDWFLDGTPTKVISEDAVVERLTRHPLFVPGQTQLGLHTATTEPFLPQVRESTFRLLELLDERRWHSDVMIITKHFVTDEDVARLASFRFLRLLLFLSYNAAPAAMERMGARTGFVERKRHTVDAILANPVLSAAHYYRPIVPGWNDSEEQIADALTFGEPLGLTVVGGLKEIPGLDDASRRRHLSIPVVPKGATSTKHFPPELLDRILRVHQQLGLRSELVGDQSCGLTVMLSRRERRAVPNVEALRMYDAVSGQPPKCMGRCLPEQMEVCGRPPAPDHATVRDLSDRMGIDAEVEITDRGVYLLSPHRPEPSATAALAAHLRYAVFWQMTGAGSSGLPDAPC